jgi:glycosyltransferase involved in cell wall biosynthesis
MAKLLFFTKMNFGNVANSGIKNKVFSQAKAIEQNGIESDVFYFEYNKFYIQTKSELKVKETSNKIQFLYYLYLGFILDLNLKEYKYLYIRHFLLNPLFLLLLISMKIKNRNLIIYMEIPTFPYHFEFGFMSFKKQLGQKIDSFSCYFLRFFLNKIVTFSSQPLIYNIKTIKTDNGIDIEKIGKINPPCFNKKELHLLGLANVQPWHGLDRLIIGMGEYYKENKDLKVFFHVVGKGDELPKLKNLVEKLDLSKYVTFYGFLSGDELKNMFEKCHIGIGSLGMHRINVAQGETSALKSREYSARGIPFVIAYIDRGFPDDFPYLLNLKADESSIEINNIISFYKEIRKQENFSELMHQYAKENLTWSAKLRPVIESFRNE